jgi:hypothetical protein
LNGVEDEAGDRWPVYDEMMMRVWMEVMVMKGGW